MANSVSLKELEDDPRLFLYTSLTAGSSHIITATSRMETILKANRIPFQAIDTATDTKARQLWQRRAGQRKLPGLVKEGFVIGDLNEVEEWNEFGELKDNIGPVPASNAAPPSGGQVGVNIAATLNTKPAIGGSSKAPVNKAPQPTFDKTKAVALPGAAEIAARAKAKAEAAKTARQTEAIRPEPLTASPEEEKKKNGEDPEQAKEVLKPHPASDHLSAPASRIQSGTATPTKQVDDDAVLPLTQAAEPTEKAKDDAIDAPSPAEETKHADDAPEPAANAKKADTGLKVHFEKEKKPEAKEEEKIPEAEDHHIPEDAAQSIEELKLEDKADEPKPQEEAAKEEDNAGKSVED